MICSTNAPAQSWQQGVNADEHLNLNARIHKSSNADCRMLIYRITNGAAAKSCQSAREYVTHICSMPPNVAGTEIETETETESEAEAEPKTQSGHNEATLTFD